MHVSVVIPVFNRAELLREALDSVFAQTYRAFEVIVIDDGSTDHTAEVLADFADRIQTIRLGRGGVSAARNAGIDVAKGNLIAFLDSDDLWLPEKLEKHVEFASVHPEMVLTYTDALQFNSQGTENGSFSESFPALNRADDLFTVMITKFAIPLTSTVMVRTSFFKETDLRFPTQIGIGEDLGLFLQMLATGGKFGYFPGKLTMRRMHDSNVSGNHCRRFEQREVLYSHLLQQSQVHFNARQLAALRLGLRDARYRVGECLWENLDLPKARGKFFRAIAPDARGVRALAYGLLSFLPRNCITALRNKKRSGLL